jgi:hypothetical protein
MGEKRKRGSPFFSYTLLPPTRPILPLLPVLPSKKSRTMLRCQINRLNKTDPEEPYKANAGRFLKKKSRVSLALAVQLQKKAKVA